MRSGAYAGAAKMTCESRRWRHGDAWRRKSTLDHLVKFGYVAARAFDVSISAADGAGQRRTQTV
jgi:hypothetical protein